MIKNVTILNGWYFDKTSTSVRNCSSTISPIPPYTIQQHRVVSTQTIIQPAIFITLALLLIPLIATCVHLSSPLYTGPNPPSPSLLPPFDTGLRLKLSVAFLKSSYAKCTQPFMSIFFNFPLRDSVPFCVVE